MIIQDLTQLGIGGVSIGAIVIIVKQFVGFIKVQENNFTKILGNHINHNTQAIQNNEKATLKLMSAINKLADKLK